MKGKRANRRQLPPSSPPQAGRPRSSDGQARRADTLPAKSRRPKCASAEPDLPYVVINMAMTADGKIATANRKVSAFGSATDREHLLALRATADAVMAGARTVDLNHITLGPGSAKYRRMRRKRGLAEYNLRVIVSRTGSVNPKATIFKHRFSPILILSTEKAGRARLKRLASLADEVKVCGRDRINFRSALIWLREHWNVKRIVCEGGGELNDGLFRAGLVDELHLTVCPLIFGGREAPTIADGLGFAKLSRATTLKCQTARRVGDEMFFVFRKVEAQTDGRQGNGGKTMKALCLISDSGSAVPPLVQAATKGPKADSNR